MNQLKKEQESVSQQVDMILSNRQRRFNFLMKKGRVEDAVAVGEEFTEWMIDLETEEILYFTEKDLIEAMG